MEEPEGEQDGGCTQSIVEAGGELRHEWGDWRVPEEYSAIKAQREILMHPGAAARDGGFRT